MEVTVTGSTDAAGVWLARAIELGREGMLARLGGPFGAVIVNGDGRIVGEGCNRVTSSNDPTAHAEVGAIRAACQALGTFNLEGHTLYTSCEPCPMCLAASYWARVDGIVYAACRADAAAGGFDDAFLYDEVAKPIAQRHLPIRQASAEAGAALFHEWVELEGRTPY